MDDQTLKNLQQKAALKPMLEAKRNELHEQRRIFEKKVLSLRAAFRKKQENVEKLEGKNLANFFFQMFGKRDEKLEQERQQAYVAKGKLDAAERELAGIASDIRKVQEQLAQSQLAEVQFREALTQKRIALKASGNGEKILEIEGKISEFQAQKDEIQEAVSAGFRAREIADRILSELEDADGWNTWDLLGGGGVLTHVAKHSHLDEAQDQVQALQSQLRRFKTELADICVDADLQVNIDGFLRFADYFFDGLFADWAVGDRIEQSRSSVSNTRHQINRMLDQLNGMELAAEKEIQRLNLQLNDWIVQA